MSEAMRMVNLSQSLLYQGFVSTESRDSFEHSPLVSIPSLSGLRFNIEFLLKKTGGRVSIPSLSGLRFNGHQWEAERCLDCSLNPFFIRASFQHPTHIQPARYPRSQSLLYQGFVSTSAQRKPSERSKVSIPSLSGLRFNRNGASHGRSVSVSIPSLSGLRFNGAAAPRTPGRLRLNPFFIRASFQRQ